VSRDQWLTAACTKNLDGFALQMRLVYRVLVFMCLLCSNQFTADF